MLHLRIATELNNLTNQEKETLKEHRNQKCSDTLKELTIRDKAYGKEQEP